MSAEECELIDALYLPSKYPLAGVLPDAAPDQAVCQQCLDIAERVMGTVRQQLRTGL